MKKISLLLLSSFTLLCANAQTDTPAKTKKAAWGYVLGMNISNLRMEGSDNSSLKTGLVTGLSVNIPVMDILSVQPQFLYSSMGGRFSVPQEKSLRLNYFSLPVLVHYKLAKNFSVLAGPQVDVLIQAKEKNSSGFDKVTDSYRENSFAATGGVAYWPIHCLQFTGRYMYGFNNVMIGMTEAKNRGVQLSVAVKL